MLEAIVLVPDSMYWQTRLTKIATTTHVCMFKHASEYVCTNNTENIYHCKCIVIE